MSPGKPLVSAIKSALICVSSIDRVRPFYEELLGLRATHETEILTDKTRRLWGVATRQVRCLRLAKPGESFGMIDLIEMPDAPADPIRQPTRPWDLGWLTINLKTNHLDRALAAARQFGAEPLSAPHHYEAGGKQIREVMIQLNGGGAGERFTLLQVGEPNELAPLFGEPVATVGAVVPALEETLAFYRDELGLTSALTLDQTGAPFDRMLGVPAGTRVQMALLTAGSNWAGKYEFLQLTRPAGSPPALDTSARADGLRQGFWMMSLMTPDLDLLQTACRHTTAIVVRGPATIDRPCFGRVRAMIVRAPGGELLECLAPATGPVPSR